MLLGADAHRRIVIVGSTGSGKTVFARRLAAALQLPHVELDAIHWGPDWSERTDFLHRVHEIVAGTDWVIEGTYRAVRNTIWSRATTLIWLNYSFPRTFSRVLRRSIRRVVTREAICGENRETFRRAFLDPGGPLWWLVHSYRRRRREFPAHFARFPQANVIQLGHPRDADALIARVQSGA